MKKFLTCLFSGLVLSVCAADSSLELQGIDGKMHKPLESGGKQAVLTIFVSPFCSTTRPFMKEINAIAVEYGDRVAVALVHSDSEVTPEVALQHADMNAVKAPVLVDSDQRLARLAGAKVTPEAVVFSPAGVVLYKGRINDLYLGPTKRQRSATVNDLRLALDAVLAGKAVPSPQHEAQGCKISLK